MTLSELIHWNRPTNIPVQRQKNRFERSLLNMQNDMDDLFQNVFGGVHMPAFAKEADFPAIDIIENDKDFKVRIELAGMQPEDVEISVADGFMKISGEKKEETEEKNDNYLCRETSYGSFQRTISLPETANCDKADASFKNGVLNIEVPKKAEAVRKPKKLQIKKAA